MPPRKRAWKFRLVTDRDISREFGSFVVTDQQLRWIEEQYRRTFVPVPVSGHGTRIMTRTRYDHLEREAAKMGIPVSKLLARMYKKAGW